MSGPIGYGAEVPAAPYRPAARPCEDCGGVVVTGTEATWDDDPTSVGGEPIQVGSDWCTNLDRPSNHAVPGLRRTGVNDYWCTQCGHVLHTPMLDVIAHRSTHGRADN